MPHIDTDTGQVFEETSGPVAGPANSLSGQPPPTTPVGAPAAAAILTPTQSSAPTGGQGLTLDPTGNIPIGVAALSLNMLTADPASPTNGMFWFRTDLNKLSVRNGATTVRSAAFT